MPQLIGFIPCEKIIVANDGAISIIGILDTITATLPHGTSTLASNTVAPIHWSVLVIFKREPEDEGKTFVQRIRFVLPNGTVGGEAMTRFVMTHGLVRNVNQGEGFPVGLAGECHLQLTIAENNGEDIVLAEYPVQIIHRPAQAMGTA